MSRTKGRYQAFISSSSSFKGWVLRVNLWVGLILWMKSAMRLVISFWWWGSQMSQMPVSIVMIGMELTSLSHCWCFSCTFSRYSRLIPSSPSRPRCLIRCRHSSGEHFRQMIAFRGHSSISDSQIWLQIEYSEASILPQRCMISPKTYLSAQGERSEQWSWFGCSLMTSFQRRLREWMALSWKVKAHRLGLVQQFWRMLTPPRLTHSSTGSLMEEMLRKERRVVLPAPKLPSIETTPDIILIALKRQLNQIKLPYTTDHSPCLQICTLPPLILYRKGVRGREQKEGKTYDG